MSTTALSGLISCGLIERDVYGDTLWVWSYPSSSETERSMVMKKCPFSKGSEEEELFVFFQFQNNWYYIISQNVNSNFLPKVRQAAVIVSGKDFNPSKYSALCDLLIERYLASGSPPQLLNVFLAVATTGRSTSENKGTFEVSEYDPRLPFITASVKSLVQAFGIESILLYVGVLLKRKIFVYQPQLSDLLEITRSIPALALPRQDWSCLHPLLDSAELSNLTQLSHYVAGVTDSSVKSRPDLYDLYVDVPAGEIIINPASREYFGLGSLLKVVANMMVELSENEETTDQQLMKEVAKKTKEFVARLKTFVDDSSVVTLESIKAQGLPASAENFFFNLGVAEGIVYL